MLSLSNTLFKLQNCDLQRVASALGELGYTSLGSLQQLKPQDLGTLIHRLCGGGAPVAGAAAAEASSVRDVVQPALPANDEKYISPLDLGYVELADSTELSAGRGAFGKVFRCSMQGEPCVMKQIPVQANSFQQVMRTLDEARYLMRLTHPNIVKYHDVFGHQVERIKKKKKEKERKR